MGGRLVNDALTNLLIPTVLSMVIGECTEVSPWLARRVLRLAARRLGNPEAAERYEAEWIALLDERPGKLLKLFFATWIALRSTWTLRAIHRPPAGSSDASGTTVGSPDARGEQRPRRGQWVRAHLRESRVRRSGGYYRGDRYYPDRRRWGSVAARRRRRRNSGTLRALGLDARRRRTGDRDHGCRRDRHRDAPAHLTGLPLLHEDPDKAGFPHGGSLAPA